MPNNITNQITFGTDKDSLSAFHEMLEFVRVKDSFLGSMDFNKLIPMPSSLNITAGSDTVKGLELYKDFVDVYLLGRDPAGFDLLNIPEKSEQVFLRLRKDIEPDVWALGKAAFQNTQKHGSPTWYEWCNKHWGTKWNAYDCIPVDEHSDTLQFFTAWDSVPEIVKLLSEKFPAQRLSYRWADEDLGQNAGSLVFKAGAVIDSDIPIEGSREAYEMAADIMSIDLAAYGYQLSKDGTTYEYRESDEPLPVEPEKPSSSKKRKSRDAR